MIIFLIRYRYKQKKEKYNFQTNILDTLYGSDVSNNPFYTPYPISSISASYTGNVCYGISSGDGILLRTINGIWTAYASGTNSQVKNLNNQTEGVFTMLSTANDDMCYVVNQTGLYLCILDYAIQPNEWTGIPQLIKISASSSGYICYGIDINGILHKFTYDQSTNTGTIISFTKVKNIISLSTVYDDTCFALDSSGNIYQTISEQLVHILSLNPYPLSITTSFMDPNTLYINYQTTIFSYTQNAGIWNKNNDTTLIVDISNIQITSNFCYVLGTNGTIWITDSAFINHPSQIDISGNLPMTQISSSADNCFMLYNVMLFTLNLCLIRNYIEYRCNIQLRI